MKVIFLDIDGVMNSGLFYRDRYHSFSNRIKMKCNIFISKVKKFLGIGNKRGINPKYYTYNYQLKRLKSETCPQKWKWLVEFCNENDIKICISSVWKNHFGDENGRIVEWWGKAFVDLGFNDDIFLGITGARKSLRGQEIQEWLGGRSSITDYAILDDDSDMLPHQFKKFHHVDGYYGMSPNHLYRIQIQFEHKGSYERLAEIFNNKTK